MESIIVLGADRVGKTTAINNSRIYLEKHRASVSICHFGVVSPKHHSPVEQFVDTLSGIDNTVDFLILDRFVSDTLFYETYRYQLPPIPDYVAMEPESMLLQISADVRVVLIEHDWNADMVFRHKQEILKQYPDCTEYWIKNQVEKRRIEHEAYYKHTNHYLNCTTLLKRVYRLSGHLCLPSLIELQMAQGFDLFDEWGVES